MKTELTELIDWFRVNKLSLNISKTNFIMFSSKRLNMKDDILVSENNLVFTNESIKEVNSLKFLGLEIDKHLDWNKQFDKTSAKLSRGIYFLNKVKNFLPHRAMVTLYYSLVHRHLMYCLVLWGPSISAAQKSKLSVQQKKAIRAINNTNYNVHTQQLFVNDKILKIHELIQFEQLKVMYQAFNNDLPKPLLNIFSPNDTFYKTRHSNDPKVLKPKFEPLSKSLFVKGPTLWANLSIEEKNSKNINAFVRKIKKKMFVKY